MKKLHVFLVIAILLLSLVLRLHNYDLYPQRGATSDEYSYSFQGVSLLTKGVPISWSAFKEYGKVKDLTIKGIYFPIVSPYFDHTPLNGIVVGAWALLFGENTFQKIDLHVIRLVPIILSMISSLLVFLLGRKLYDFRTGIWALLIYTTTTIFVMNGRVVLAENLMTPIILIASYYFIKTKRQLMTKQAIILGVFAGLAFWTKELGAALFVSLFYLFILEKIKIKQIMILSAVFLASILLYILYGIHYNAHLFFQILGTQSGRNVGPGTLLYITSTPIIVNKFYYDGWYFLGFFTFFLGFLSFKENKYLLIPAFVYFLALLLALTQRGEMGWYIIPLFPFMALFTAHFIRESILNKDKRWGIFVFVIFIGLYTIHYLFEVPFGLSPIRYRILMAILFLPFFIVYLFKKDRLFIRLSSFWFYVFILFNIILTYTYIHPS